MAVTLPRLGVNIDHVATLRQARGEFYPSLVEAAKICLNEGADQITIHLREDRRHIQDTDVSAIKAVTQIYNKPLNLEMGCSDEIIGVAIETKPDWICVVPENRLERTTEGGLDLINPDNFRKVELTCIKLKKFIPNLKISLFVEAKEEIIKQVLKLPIDAVEIHTGDYSIAQNSGEDILNFLSRYQKAHDYCLQNKINFHAGHGLTNKNILPLLKLKIFEEYNIGHWLICDAVFSGLASTVKSFKELLNENS